MNAFDRTRRLSTGVVVAVVAALSLGVGAALQPVVAQGTSYLSQTFRIGAATPYNLTWPADVGAADGVLQTDGSGALAWVSNIPNTALSMATGSVSGNVTSAGTDPVDVVAVYQIVLLPQYSFIGVPSITSPGGRSSISISQDGLDPSDVTGSDTDGLPRVQLVASGGRSTNTATYSYTWHYISASDRPSVWAMLDAAGTVVSLWEAEDPVSADDTVAPLVTDESTHRVVNMGVPSLAVITTLADALTADQQTDLLTRLDAYVADERGWLSAVTALADLATIETRYEPSARQWAMRLLAEVRGISVTALYRTDLAVDTATDTWVVPSE